VETIAMRGGLGLETVDLRIPAKPEYISVARLATSAIAVHHAFSYDEIEDLKIAVSEACTALIASGAAEGIPIALHFSPERSALAVSITTTVPEPAAPEAMAAEPPLAGDRSLSEDPPLGLFLMQCLVDEVRRVDQGGNHSFRLLKRRREHGDDGPPAPGQDRTA
jgi:serine/threonine-protein kinase RsbW